MKRKLFSSGVLFPVIVMILLAGGRAHGQVPKGNFPPKPIARFSLAPTQSTFIVHAKRAGLAWFKGHDHLIAARDFAGTASFSPDDLQPAFLTLTVKSASLEETSSDFTSEQKAVIKKELDEIVLEAAKYPDITFTSTGIKGKIENGAFAVKIEGDLTLHGVTKHIVIPAVVNAIGNTMRAKGAFSIDRKDFGVNATEAFHGFVKVRHKLKFAFDIVAVRI